MPAALFAGMRVRDFAAARGWYERLLGEVTFLAHATEGVWEIGEGRSIFVEEDPDRAGHCRALVFVDDLEAQVAEIAARGLEPDERLTYSNGVRKAVYLDPDGNEVGFGGAPLAAPDANVT